MSMTPLFPSLRPRISKNLWFGFDKPKDEDVQLRQIEKVRSQMFEKMESIGSEINPVGIQKLKEEEPKKVIEESGDDSDSRNEEEYEQFAEDQPDHSSIALEDSIETNVDSPQQIEN